MSDAFLAGLPDPQVIETVDFEAIVTEIKGDLSARFPAVTPVLALESAALVQLIQTVAYEQIRLRARINAAARANLLAFATGADLDHVGANASPSVQRLPDETDERFRLRILDAIRARNIGSPEFYRYTAMTFDPTISDAIAYRNGRDPTVYVAVFTTAPDGAATAAQIAALQAHFQRNDLRLVNSDVVVVSAVSNTMPIVATIIARPGYAGTLAAQAEAALRAAWAAEGGLGRDLTRDWIKARLLVSGAYRVELAEPVADLIVPPNEAASIGPVTLTVTGENN